MAGIRDAKSILVKLEWFLNWVTFVARSVPHILITAKLIKDTYKFEKGMELPLALLGMAGMNLLNIGLGIDLLKAFMRERRSQQDIGGAVGYRIGLIASELS
ncbi:hypothetical protein JHK85_051359 [Glycine max]|nr:hypothetical protein JHK86_050499 [Glycine max]KAG4936440.1 hypothetical protein JHK85_051359 [Glycine max]